MPDFKLNGKHDRRFFTWYMRNVELLSVFVKKLKKSRDVDPSTFFRRLTAGKNVSSWGGKTAWCFYAALIPSF
jgi:hypothetical protein